MKAKVGSCALLLEKKWKTASAECKTQGTKGIVNVVVKVYEIWKEASNFAKEFCPFINVQMNGF